MFADAHISSLGYLWSKALGVKNDKKRVGLGRERTCPLQIARVLFPLGLFSFLLLRTYQGLLLHPIGLNPPRTPQEVYTIAT